MFNVMFKGLWARKRRLIGTCTAVILGVAFLAATLVLGDTMRAGFAEAFTDANAGIDVVVRSNAEMGSEELHQRDLIDSSIVDQVAAVDGVRAAVPSIEGVGTILDANGDRIGGNGPPTTATNWIDDPDLNPYRLAEGRAPAAPGEVVIDRGAARNGDLAIGDRTTILTPDPVEVTIVGIATFGDVDSLGPTTYTAFTLDAARDLLANRPDGISAVLVAAEDGVNTDTLRDEIEQLMPARIEALTQSELTAEQQADIESDFLGLFQTILLAFAGIALIVATFSIHNTFSILVAQRTRESALLRAIGAFAPADPLVGHRRGTGHRDRRLGDRHGCRARPGHRAARPDGRGRPRPADRRPRPGRRHRRHRRRSRRRHDACRQHHAGAQGVAGGPARRPP